MEGHVPILICSICVCFDELENDGALNIENKTDLFALHDIFVPRIKESLCAFREAWNTHCLQKTT